MTIQHLHPNPERETDEQWDLPTTARSDMYFTSRERWIGLFPLCGSWDELEVVCPEYTQTLTAEEKNRLYEERIKQSILSSTTLNSEI